MKRVDCVKYILGREGKIFTVRFRKRTGKNEIRKMVCRQGVKSHLAENPTKEPIDFVANALIPVFDMEKNAYRSIPIEGIIEIKIEGEWVRVTD